MEEKKALKGQGHPESAAAVNGVLFVLPQASQASKSEPRQIASRRWCRHNACRSLGHLGSWGERIGDWPLVAQGSKSNKGWQTICRHGAYIGIQLWNGVMWLVSVKGKQNDGG